MKKSKPNAPDTLVLIGLALAGGILGTAIRAYISQPEKPPFDYDVSSSIDVKNHCQGTAAAIIKQGDKFEEHLNQHLKPVDVTALSWEFQGRLAATASNGQRVEIPYLCEFDDEKKEAVIFFQ